MTDTSETTMNLADYAKAFRAQLKWIPETEEAFEYGLNVLPPLAWNGLGFLVGEAYSFRNCTVSGNGRQTYTAHAKIQNDHQRTRYYVASMPLTVAEWKAMTRKDILENVETPIAESVRHLAMQNRIMDETSLPDHPRKQH